VTAGHPLVVVALPDAADVPEVPGAPERLVVGAGVAPDGGIDVTVRAGAGGGAVELVGSAGSSLAEQPATSSARAVNPVAAARPAAAAKPVAAVGTARRIRTAFSTRQVVAGLRRWRLVARIL
jgi:hypothetical protein